MLSRWSCLISVLGIIAITVGVFGESNVPEAEINVDRTNDGLSTSSDTLQKEAETILIDGFNSDQLSKLREDHEGAEKLEFQAEVHRMMQLIVNSLYKNKEIFLRELISNASDALDKIRVLSLTDREALSSTNELSIRIKTNKEAGTLHIIDTGIGMSKQEMVDNLGTIAKSGTSEFIAQLSAVDKSADASNLIGQFGVGFYSAFLVSKKVMVVSKKDGHEQYIWESNAESFSIIKDPRGDTLKRGTEIILFLNEEAKDYLQPETIKQLIKKRSQFVNFPIYVWSSRVESVQEEKSDESESSSSDAEASVEEEKKESKTIEKTIWDWNQVNEQKPIWKKKPANVTESEYTEFYKFLSGDKDDPLAKVHFTAEGDITFTGLVYVPKRASGSLFNVNAEFSDRIKLYVRQVFIADAGEDLTHKYLSFIFGLVDSEDLPLNVSREMLQQSQLIKVIKKKLVRKILHALSKLPEEEYEKFWKEYSVHIKLGTIEDQSNRGKLTELLRFVTSKSEGKLVSLQDYISRMKKDQKSIYYLTGSSLADVKSSPFVERMIKKGYEVIYMIDSIDEFLVDSLTTYKEKSVQNVAKDGLDLGSSEDVQRKVDQRKAFDPLLNWLKDDALKGKIEKAELSERLLESPSALVATKYGWSGNMERVMLAQTNQKGDDTTGNYYANLPKVMEINPRHPLVKELAERVRSDPNDADAKETAELLFYVATLRSGYSIKDTVDFAKKIEVVMRKNLAVDLSEEVEAEIEEAGPDDDVKTTDEDSDDASAPKDEVSKQDETHSSSTEDINENGEDIEEVCKDCPPFRRLLQWAEEEEELDFPLESDGAEDDDENDGEDSDNEEIDDIEEQVSGTSAEEHEDEKEQDDDETDDIESEDDAMLDDTEVDVDYNLGEEDVRFVCRLVKLMEKRKSTPDLNQMASSIDDLTLKQNELLQLYSSINDNLAKYVSSNNCAESDCISELSNEFGSVEQVDEFEPIEPVGENEITMEYEQSNLEETIDEYLTVPTVSKKSTLESTEIKMEGKRRLRKFLRWLKSKRRSEKSKYTDSNDIEDDGQIDLTDMDSISQTTGDLDDDLKSENMERSSEYISEQYDILPESSEDIAEEDESEDIEEQDFDFLEYGDVGDPQFDNWKPLDDEVPTKLGARKLLAVKPSIPEKKKKQSKSIKPKTKVPKSEPAEVSKASVQKPSSKSKISVLQKQIIKQKAPANKPEKKVKATSELTLDAFKSIRESKPKPLTPTPKPMRVVGTPDDHDCDGIPDSIDEDIDNDGLLDRTQDSDWDGELNHIDDDDDNDGIPDIEDEDANGDGIPDCRSDTSDHQFVVRFKGKRRTIDSDMDGIPDDQDKDDDDDGIPDIMEDDDGNQIPDAFNLSLDDLKRLSGHELAKTLAAHGWFDHDCDGIPDDLDPDDDNDGFFDNKQDSDRDGILNQWDDDDDNDGIPDSEDPDSNGDGIPDCIIKDTDNDGIPDHIDTDDDNDGIPDLQDPDHLTFNYFKDSDGDGIPDILDKDDDNDGIPDHNDQDADGDGSNDLYQDLDMDGVPDSLDDDMDNDGIPDHLQDHDCDGIPDIIDPDDDNDGFFDNKQDSDKDGILNEWDDDDDNDGIPDKDDPDSNGDGIIDCQPKDSDGDGIPDHLDDDDDNDGIPDHQDPDSISFLLYKHKKHLEAIPDNETEMARDQANLMNVDLGDPDDKDCDGIPDHLDNDQDNDGKIDRTQDSDMDGMLNHVDEDDDNDGIPDHLDPDANGDGIPDCRRDSNLHYKLIKSPSGLIKKVLRMRNPTQEEQHMVFLVNEAKRKLIKAKEKMFSPPPRRPLQSKLMTTPAPITQNEEQNTENVEKNAKPKKKSKKLKAKVLGSRKLSVVDDDLNLDPHQFDDKPLLEDEEDMMDLVTESHELDDPQENSKFKFFPGAMAVDAQAIKKATIKKAKIEAEMKKSKKEQNTSPPVKVPKKGLKEVPVEKRKPQNCKTGYCPAPVTNTADRVRKAGQSAKYQRMAETKVIVESEDEDEEDDDENAEADDQDDEIDYMEDEDGDGIPDYLEGDSDGDGIPDYLEDEDGDGIPDYLEDEDGDGIPDYLDEDSGYNTDDDDDNDGILDYHEDEDGNQMLDILEGKDTDGDGIPDYLDDDDDNDGVPDSQDEDDDGDGIADVYEDENRNQVPDHLEMEDSDGDGIIDLIDTDDDNDNIPDYLDDDDDGDGILDVDEDENQDKIPDVLELSRKGLSKISIPKQSTTKVTQEIKIAEQDDDEDDDDDEEDTDETDEDEGIESGASYVYEDDDEEEEADEEEPSALRANVNRVLRWIESIVGVENSNES